MYTAILYLPFCLVKQRRDVDRRMVNMYTRIIASCCPFQRDTHMELTSRVEALENELERKDNIISELQDELVYKVSSFSQPVSRFYSE